MPEALLGMGGLKALLLALLSFLMGAIPFGPIAAARKGVDLKNTGSRNTGATNVLRTAGKGAALFTLLGDILKGTGAVALGRALGGGPALEGALGLCAVLGHDFSPFMGFRGGKGVATSIGVLLIYAPKAGILTVIVWLAVIYLSKVSSIAALSSFAVLPLAMAAMGYGSQKVAVAAVISLLLYARHAGNIKRILNGTERRIGETTEGK